MKKHLLLILALAITSTLFAAPISTGTAVEWANRFIKNNNLHMQQVTSDHLVFTERSAEGNPVYYVFNVSNDGFIIVSAEDFTLPILGYSDENEFDKDNIPVNMYDILADYRTEVQYAQKRGLIADAEIIKAREDQLNNVAQYRSSVAPLLGAIKWNQSPYYNDLCPVYNSYGNRCPVGCVATAMAQIMKYWGYPSRGQGSHSYNSSYGTLSANFDVEYDWASMPEAVLTSPNSECAKISYHCAVSVNMGFSPSGSGAYQTEVPNALVTYFKYRNTAQNANRSSYSATNWANLVKSELDANRPVQYAGHGTGGGHSFVCDGYNSNGYFHFNWGWGGMSDGYFLLNALNPGSLGTGGGSGGFNSYQTIVIGIQPDEVAPPTPLGVPSGLYASNITANSATLNWNAVQNATSYTVAFRSAGGEWSYSNIQGTYANATDLAANTTYEWTVKANNSTTSSNYANVISFVTLDNGGTPPTPPTPTPDVPSGLYANNVTTNSARLNWNAVQNATSYTVAFRNAGGEWGYYEINGTYANATNLAANTTYEWTVKANNDNTSSDYAGVVSFVTLDDGDTPPTPVEYCASKATTSYYEWISRFAMANVDNYSEGTQYADYTNKVINVGRGDAVTMYFKSGYRGSSYNEYWNVWIDYNHDEEFSDDEIVVRGYYYAGYTLQATITIPNTALLGETRLRISMKYGNYANACELFYYGEVEDYTVNIGNQSNMQFASIAPAEDAFDLNEGMADNVSIYPNPASDRIQVNLNEFRGQEAPYSIIDMQGRVLMKGNLMQSNEIDITQLSRGTYFLSIETETGTTLKFIKE